MSKTPQDPETLVEHQQTLYASNVPTRRWLHRSRKTWFDNAIAAWAQPDRSGVALEVGPGSGVYLETLAEHFSEVVASDIEPAYLRHAANALDKHANIRFVQDDITTTGLPHGRFDLILCTEVIEHIRDSQAALRGMYALLRPGGILLLSTPQRYSTLETTARVALLPGVIRLVQRVYGEPVLAMGHINLLTERQCTRQVEEAGFTILERHKSGLYLPGLAEFIPETALIVERALEPILRATPLSGLLWTQYYVCRK